MCNICCVYSCGACRTQSNKTTRKNNEQQQIHECIQYIVIFVDAKLFGMNERVCQGKGKSRRGAEGGTSEIERRRDVWGRDRSPADESEQAWEINWREPCERHTKGSRNGAVCVEQAAFGNNRSPIYILAYPYRAYTVNGNISRSEKQ